MANIKCLKTNATNIKILGNDMGRSLPEIKYGV